MKAIALFAMLGMIGCSGCATVKNPEPKSTDQPNIDGRPLPPQNSQTQIRQTGAEVRR